MFRTAILGAAFALALSGSVHAQGGAPFKIGVLTDFSGGASDFSGAGSVVAARMAVADFGGKLLGRPIELVQGDHQQKPDLGLSIANKWWKADGVSVIVDVPGSAVGMAVQNLSAEVNKVALITGSLTTALTNQACVPTAVHWMVDTYATAYGVVAALVKPDQKWFFVTNELAFGRQLEVDASAAIGKLGGKVIGSAVHPVNMVDFSSILTTAQQARPDVIAFADGGKDLVNGFKTAAEFNLTSGTPKLVALLTFITDVHAIGLDVMQNSYLVTSFYWDRDEASRAFARRFMERFKSAPTLDHAGVYTALMHYFKAVEAVGSDDGRAVVARMKETPIEDFTGRARIREDGRVLRDYYLARVKTSAESTGPWDLYKIEATIPAEQAVWPLSDSKCPLVKK